MATAHLDGPIVITGSTGQIGRALQKHLTDLPNEVRALDRRSDLGRAVRDAAAVVHLAGTLQPAPGETYVEANLETAQATAAAIARSSVRRIVFLSFLTADTGSTNPYLRSKGLAEQVLADTGVPTVVLRTGHVYGPPWAPGPTATSLLPRRGRVVVLGPGTQRLTPVFLDDVAAAVAHAALWPDTPTGTHELAGPETMTMDEFALALHGGPVRLLHMPTWLVRRLARSAPSLPAPLADVLLADAVPTRDALATADAFGVDLHSVAEVWGTR